MAKQTLKFILKVFAKIYLWRFHPKIVAITGSVGKTSTKQAISTVLKNKYKVRESLGNYNNELGVPLTIIGAESSGKNILGWAVALIAVCIKLFQSSYPQILVLELGADRPGDINYLVDLLGKIEVAVLTDIGISHLEFFASPNELAREKLSLIKKLAPTSAAVLNFDSPKVYEGRTQTKAEVLGFGFSDSPQFKASDFHLIKSEDSWGVNFKLHSQGNVVPFFLPNSLGKPSVYAALAAIAVGSRFGMDLVNCSEALKQYVPPPGRLRLLKGIKQTLIIDDTYNAAPASTIAALDALVEIAPGRKVAALGGMAELGTESEAGHKAVAAKIIEKQIDQVFLVGDGGKIIKSELEKRQFGGRLSWFGNVDQAGLQVQQDLVTGDTILVKGSQAARMEKIVKEIMADPMLADKLLVRQEAKWL